MRRAILTGKGRRWSASGHPWVYADDVSAVDGEPGELLPVLDPAGQTLGWALFSRGSRIALRFVTRDATAPDRAFWKARLERAVAARARAGLLAPQGACRLVNGDADLVPGFVADRYADVLVLQCTTQAADRMRDALLELLQELLPRALRAVLDRSDSVVRRMEGLAPRVEWLRGSAPESLVVEEPGLAYEVDIVAGHKTGHYLDQRENRVAAAGGALGVAGERVLDVFSYDGLFGIRAALAGAAEVVCLDQSLAAGERLVRNAERNGVAGRVRFEKANALPDLRRRAQMLEADGAAPFDRVILDPPAFARNRRQVEGAARGYRELNLRAMKLLRPGGKLVTCSCSYNVGREAFLGFLAEAARDAGRDVYVEDYTGAAVDHPWLLALPESSYLKCAFLRVEER